MQIYNKIYHLRSFHGGKMLCRRKDSILFCSDNKHAYDDNLFSLVRAIIINNKIFIYSECLDSVSIVSSKINLQMPYFYFINHGDNKITIVDNIFDCKYITSLHPNEKDGLGHLQAGVEHIDDWEIFHLEEVEDRTEFECDFLKNIESFLNLDFRKIETIINFINSYDGKYLDVSLSHIMQNISLDDIENISKILINDNEIISKIRNKSFNLFGKYIKNTEKFPPCSLDFYKVCSYNSGEIFYDIFQAINFYIRQLELPKKNICILATMRNEGIYILEWIAYHRHLGVDHFFIYSNNNDDGSEKILEILDKENIITYIKNDVDERGLAQNKAYSHALSFNNDILNYKWCAVIDADEFIYVDKKKFCSLNDFLYWMDFMSTDAVAMNWKFMKSNEISNFQEVFLPLTSRNTQVVGAGGIGDGHLLIKSLFKTKEFLHSHPHHPCLNNRFNYSYRLTDRTEHKYDNPPKGFHKDPSFSDNYSGYGISLLHFYFKSNVEWFWKACRNRGDEILSLFDITKFNDNWITPYRMQIEDKHKEDINISNSFHNELDILKKIPEIIIEEDKIRKNFIIKFNSYYKKLLNYYTENNISLSKENKIYFDSLMSKIYSYIME